MTLVNCRERLYLDSYHDLLEHFNVENEEEFLEESAKRISEGAPEGEIIASVLEVQDEEYTMFYDSSCEGYWILQL